MRVGSDNKLKGACTRNSGGFFVSYGCDMSLPVAAEVD
jgi:hypothetical protein